MTANHRFYRPPSCPGLTLRQGSGCIVYGMHTHPAYALGLVLSGTSQYRCQNRLYAARRGTAMLMPPDTPHACNPQPQQTWHYLMCYVQPEYWRHSLAAANINPQRIQPLLDGAPIRNRALNHALLTLLRQLRDQHDADQAIWLAVLNILAAATDAADTHDASAATSWRPYWHRLPEEAVDTDAWAAHLGLSRRSLTRQMQPSGMTPHQWLLNRRINQAKAALQQGMSLAQAAQACGFADQAHFQRWFKRLTAVTPGAYRNLCQTPNIDTVQGIAAQRA